MQAFDYDSKGNRESRPLRSGTTDPMGKYAIEPLPDGDYTIGVNAEAYRDNDPYPPTVYANQIRVDNAGHVDGVDLALPPKRAAAQLHVEAVLPSGAPLAGASFKLSNLAGVQRWYSNETTTADGVMQITAYQGEEYVLEASHYKRGLKIDQDYDYLSGSARIKVTEPRHTVVVVLSPVCYPR